MKRIVGFLTLVAVCLTMHRATAQCTLSNFEAAVKSVRQVGNASELTVDISFTGEFNNGNKYAIVHLWQAAPVNNYPAVVVYDHPPTNSQLANALANIVIEMPGHQNSQLATAYPVPGQSGIPVIHAGINYSRTRRGNRYEISLSNVKVRTAPGANIRVRGDVWSSQSSQAQHVHCFSRGTDGNRLATTTISGSVDCGKPRRFQLTIDNSSYSLPVSAAYTVYWDDGDRVFEPTTATNGATKDVEVNSNTVSEIAANGTYTTPLTTYLPYANQDPDATHVLFVSATVTSTEGTRVYDGLTINNMCFTLPVKYNFFNVVRNQLNQQQIDLTWQTAQEQHNKGFYVQRKTSGAWEDIGLVFSGSDNGNSSTPITYRFKDKNIFSGNSQYRLLQVDLDGRGTYSDVKAITGEDFKQGMFLFPNPANDGQEINLLFADIQARDLFLSDMNGRIVRQYRNYTQGTLTIQGLRKGFYTLKAVAVSSGETTIEKIVVK